jgi:F0F1-type ATP synthase assembly protein I
MKADPGKNLKDYARYSGLAFQMLFIILAGVWGGLKLDDWLHLKPLFTIVLTIISVVMAIYFAIKDLLRK